MQEIEIKVLEVDTETLRQKLISMGARAVFDGELVNLFFDSDDERLRKTGRTLRLRKKGERSVFAFKKLLNQSDAKVCEEIEVEVSDFDLMKKILEGAGLGAWSSMKKYRASYRLDDTQFELDRYLNEHAYIPPLLEIEAKDAETAYRYAEILGFKKQECLPWSITDLVKHYSKLR